MANESNHANIKSNVTDNNNFDKFGKYDKDLYTSQIIPVSYKNAIKDPEWNAAIQTELQSWHRLNVYTVAPRTKDIQPIPTLWKFTKKDNGKLKARIIASGNLDKEKYSKGEKRSPTSSHLTIKWFIAHAIRRGWHLQHIDIDAAFLNANIDWKKYIQILESMMGDTRTQVGLLNKTLYGLPIASSC